MGHALCRVPGVSSEPEPELVDLVALEACRPGRVFGDPKDEGLTGMRPSGPSGGARGARRPLAGAVPAARSAGDRDELDVTPRPELSNLAMALRGARPADGYSRLPPAELPPPPRRCPGYEDHEAARRPRPDCKAWSSADVAGAPDTEFSGPVGDRRSRAVPKIIVAEGMWEVHIARTMHKVKPAGGGYGRSWPMDDRVVARPGAPATNLMAAGVAGRVPRPSFGGDHAAVRGSMPVPSGGEPVSPVSLAPRSDEDEGPGAALTAEPFRENTAVPLLLSRGGAGLIRQPGDGDDGDDDDDFVPSDEESPASGGMYGALPVVSGAAVAPVGQRLAWVSPPPPRLAQPCRDQDDDMGSDEDLREPGEGPTQEAIILRANAKAALAGRALKSAALKARGDKPRQASPPSEDLWCEVQEGAQEDSSHLAEGALEYAVGLMVEGQSGALDQGPSPRHDGSSSWRSFQSRASQRLGARPADDPPGFPSGGNLWAGRPEWDAAAALLKAGGGSAAPAAAPALCGPPRLHLQRLQPLCPEAGDDSPDFGDDSEEEGEEGASHPEDCEEEQQESVSPYAAMHSHYRRSLELGGAEEDWVVDASAPSPAPAG